MVKNVPYFCIFVASFNALGNVIGWNGSLWMGKSNTYLNDVTFHLYTKSNQYTPQEITRSSSSISNSHFNPKNPTRVAIHGWNSSAPAWVNTIVRDAWLSNGDMNVIIVDWILARTLDYLSAVIAVPTTGKKIARFIDFLSKFHGLSKNNTIVIGHSLGAQVAGYAGKNMKNGQLHTIVGLDPARLFFNYDKPMIRLSSIDAINVQSIQTCVDKIGYLKPIGTNTFYPNGGKSQPGCGLDVTGSCAHNRAVIYYAEAVRRNNFLTIKCSDYKAAVSGNCGNTYSSIKMGDLADQNKSAGIYYVPVRNKYPFGMGNKV